MPPGGMRGGGMPLEEAPPLTWRAVRANFGKFISYYRPHRGLLVLDMASGVSNAALTIVVPLIVYRVFQQYLPEMALGKILAASGLLLVLQGLISLTGYISTRWGHALGARMEADMRQDLFDHLQKLPFGYFDKTPTGQIMARMSSDLMQITEVAHHCPEDILIASLTMIGAVAVMTALNPLMMLAALVPLPLIILWGTVFQGRMHKGFREVRRKTGELTSRVENSVQGIREVKGFCREPEEAERFRGINREFRKRREDVFITLGSFHAGMSFMIEGYSLVFIAAGSVLMYYNRATIAEVLVFLMYARYFTMPIFRLINFVEQFQQGFAAFERFTEVLAEAPEVPAPEHPVRLENVRGTISFENVVFRYPSKSPDREPVLRDVSLELAAGETTALVGESGAGKSTLAALIPRFYDVQQGSIRLDGQDVRDLDLRDLRSRIGIVRQSPFLFDSTIRENVLFGRPGATEAELRRAVENANLAEFVDSLPEGLDARVGEHGVRLSGGQKQRISIARVFLKDPAILIFDEATSSLDNESEEEIRQAMERLCGGRTTLVIAHRLSTVRDVARILCMRHGEIVEAGTHAELLAKQGYYHKLYSMHTF